jgi:hypothetical protein
MSDQSYRAAMNLTPWARDGSVERPSGAKFEPFAGHFSCV